MYTYIWFYIIQYISVTLWNDLSYVLYQLMPSEKCKVIEFEKSQKGQSNAMN